MPEKKANNKFILYACIASLIIFFILLVGSLKGGFFLPVDNWVYSQNAAMYKPVIPVIMLLITSIMSLQGAIMLSAIAFSVLLSQKKARQAWFLVISLVACYVFWESAKFLVQRLRPEIRLAAASGFSFPSGHAATAAVFFGLMIYLFKDEFKSVIGKRIFIVVCAIIALLVSYSRIYLGVHWLSDVLAGIALGVFIATAAVLVMNHKL